MQFFLWQNVQANSKYCPNFRTEAIRTFHLYNSPRETEWHCTFNK